MKTQHGVTVVFQPDGKKSIVKAGTSVLEAARKAGVTITTRCGGKAGCLMCKVKIAHEDATAVRSPGDVEQRKLGSALEDGMRLACQTSLWSDVTIQVPEDPLKAAIRRKLEAARRGEEDTLW